MTEDQKYQGHLYREKPAKNTKRKSVSILEPNENNALVSLNPTVEDEVPPPVPTPPPAVDTRNQDSVFDYLVEDENPNTPQIQFATEREEMFMKNGAPSLFNSRPTSRSGYRNKEEQLESTEYELNGYTYGAEPVNPKPVDFNASSVTLDFMTPSAKVAKAKLDRNIPESAGHSRQNSNSEKKRKRAQTDDINGDTIMADVPGTVVRSVVETSMAPHSGLTGGIQRMLTDKDDKFAFPRSPASSPDPDPDRRALAKIKPVKPPKHTDLDPQSPLKRSRRAKEEDPNGLGISIKGRAGKVMSKINGALSTANAEGAVGKSSSSSRQRRASSSDAQGNPTPVRARDPSEKREHKKHKVTRHNGTSSANVRMASKSSTRRTGSESASPDLSKPSKNGKSAQKQIEYHSHPDSRTPSRHRPVHSPSESDDDHYGRNGSGDQVMVVFGAEERLRRKCDDFLAYISKGPSSSKGYSINKVLKRYHKDSEILKDAEKREEEKELWKGLRLKRNDRGEVVVFFV